MTSYGRSMALTRTKYVISSLLQQLLLFGALLGQPDNCWFKYLLSDFSHSCLSSAGILSKDSPEFDLTFENAFDQWVAGSAGEKCTFIQILHHTCQRYSSARKPEFINCQSKLLGGKTANEQTLLTVLHQYFYLEQSGSEMPELLLSHCAVSQFESHYIWWQPTPAVFENACFYLVHSICWVLCWSEVNEDVQQNTSAVNQSSCHRWTCLKHR